MQRLDGLINHLLWTLWPPGYPKVGRLFSDGLDEADRHSSTDASPEAARIGGLAREGRIQGNYLDNSRPETQGTTVSPPALLKSAIA